MSEWTIHSTLEWTESHFAQNGEQNPRLFAQTLLAYVTGLSRLQLYLDYERPLSLDERALLRESIRRRDVGEPLQYIIGKTHFRYLELMMRRPVLIPRPETEMLVDLVLAYLSERETIVRSTTCDITKEAMAADGKTFADQAFAKVLDIGTGTGCIALSILHEYSQAIIIATDIDQTSVTLAKENAQSLNLDNEKSLHIVLDDLATSLTQDASSRGSFDVVVSNPPYIPSAQLQLLPAEVKEFENPIALDGGDDGLAMFRRIAIHAQVLLRCGGLLACELYEDCLDAAAAELAEMCYCDIKIKNDLTGRQRFILARKQSEAPSICSAEGVLGL